MIILYTLAKVLIEIKKVEIDNDEYPNQIVFNTLIKEVKSSLLISLGLITISSLNVFANELKTEIWILFLLGSLTVGVLFFFLNENIIGCLKLLNLRIAMYRSKQSPWNYQKFLKYACNQGILINENQEFSFISEEMKEYYMAIKT